jgi:hypothetical protein
VSTVGWEDVRTTLFFEIFLKEHVPPCVVLVINDNPYGLIFALSYICRTCP